MKQTPFDEITQNRHLQMLKAAIPYTNAKRQRILSTVVKVMELQQTMQLFSSDEGNLKICEVAEEPSMFHLLTAIREYCTKPELETIDQLLNVYDMMQAYEMMQGDAKTV